MTRTAAPVATTARLPVLCAGGTVVCVATGPSLTAEDVAYCRGKATVLVVNDAHRLAPWADVLWSSDRYWWAFYRGVPEFGGLKATIEYTPGRKPERVMRLVPDMICLRHTGHAGIETSPDGVRTGGQSSGGAAVNVAVHLGAKRIVLLGYDCGVPGPQRHFFGDHPKGLSNRSPYPTWRAAFDRMKGPLEQLGIDVINASRSTAISAFPCRQLEEAL